MATVLIVEDERDIRDLLSEAVRNMGHYAIESSDGQKAVERASIDLPDMILLDVWMPRMNGFEVLRMLGEKPATRDIPVVLITAVPSSEGEKKGRDLGVRHYIEKPWEPGRVEATIRVVLREVGISASMDSGSEDSGSEDPGSDEAPEGDSTVNLTSEHTNNQTLLDSLARFESGRKKDKDTDEEEAGVPVIKTGDRLIALEQKMGGGLPLRSVTLAVGPAASGKSSLCQHLVYGALEQGYGTAYFSSEQSAEGLIGQMSSIGLGVSRHLRKNQLRIHSVPEPTEDEKPEVLLNQLSRSMERLSRGAQFIVVDSLTDLAGSCPEQAVIAFFSACRRLGNHGRTIFISIHSYAFGSEMFTRLRTLCDGYITLGSEQMMGKSVRTLEVNKIGTVEQNRDNMVSFVVEPEVGMRLLPLNKTRA